MAVSGGGSSGNINRGSTVSLNRDDPLAKDRLECLDLEELVSIKLRIEHQRQYLEDRVKEQRNRVKRGLNLLCCHSQQQFYQMMAKQQQQQQQLDDEFSKDEKHNSEVTKERRHHVPKRYTLVQSGGIRRAAAMANVLAVHSLLGTAVSAVNENRFIVKIRCYEDYFSQLPQMLFTLHKIPNTSLFTLLLREIKGYLNLDEELFVAMERLTMEEMIAHFHKLQEIIYYIIDNDYIYQSLVSQRMISRSLSCTRSRDTISFNIPKFKNHIETMQLKSGKRRCHLRSSIDNTVSVILCFTPNAPIVWQVKLACKGSMSTIPKEVLQVLLVLEEVSTRPVVECVKEMLENLKRLGQDHSASVSRLEASDDLSTTRDGSEQFHVRF